MKEFFRSCMNFWYFRKEIWNYRYWDYGFCLDIFRKSLEGMRFPHTEGEEEQVKMIKGVTEALQHEIDDDFIEQAEKVLGYDVVTRLTEEQSLQNKAIFDLAVQIEEANWNNIWDTIKQHMKGWWD